MPHRTLDEYMKQITTPRESQSIIKQPTAKNKFKIIGFYSETEFKQTLIGKIPKEWRAVRLGQIVDVYDSRRIPLSERERANRKGPYPYCGANGIIDYIDDYIFDGEYLLLAEDGGYYGPFEKSAYIMNGKFWVNNHAHVLKAKDGIAINKFLMYMLNFLDLRPYLVGSTRTKLNQKDMKRITLPLPPLEEQWGIAEVLSSVDEAIEATGRLIGRLERLKRGLMQELLTKGIGHKEYKQTPIGKIPKEWQVVKLSRIARIIMGQSPPSSTYNEEGIGLPFLQGKAEFGRVYPKPVMYTSKPIKIAEKGDLLISVRAPVGDVNIAPFKLCIGRGLASIRFNRDRASTLFYFYYFQLVKPRLEAMGKGSTFKAITKKDLENLLVPLPPLDEQDRVASTLKAVDDWISAEEKRKEKLERLKRGLMELLLTGRVRVRVERLGDEGNLPGSGGGVGS